MLQAKALIYAIVVSLLIAMLSSLLVSLSLLYRMQQIDQFSQERSIRNIQSGIALLLGEGKDFYEIKSPEYFKVSNDRVVYKKINWGLFDIGFVQSVIQSSLGPDTLEKTFVVGVSAKETPNYALKMKDLNSPLKMAGMAKIKGACYLPRAGYEKGHINGRGAFFGELIKGKVLPPATYLPKVDTKRLSNILNEFIHKNDGVPVPDTLIQSFGASTVYLSGRDIQLNMNNLSGNIVIVANKIRVSPKTKLSDVILLANEIEFMEGFTGNAQAYALDKILIEEDVYLQYPSVVGAIRKKNKKEGTSILVKRNAIVEGMIFSYELSFNRKLSTVKLEKDSHLLGHLFSNGSLDLRGMVDGMVTTKQFSVKTSSSVNDHFILDGQIDRTALPVEYVSPVFLDNYQEQSIAKWIN